jgi:hypothetical protein
VRGRPTRRQQEFAYFQTSGLVRASKDAEQKIAQLQAQVSSVLLPGLDFGAEPPKKKQRCKRKPRKRARK